MQNESINFALHNGNTFGFVFLTELLQMNV